ncbi:hypothetical protein [Luteimonas terrae]|uniref:Lipoprotein n=1 Tax=Luteimonas terrae TaxID=1530191 RepID=A0ABU1XVS0_9GAMM|nr:hypothetical protein [Luteimonas terrae]MDR7192854.1 hypothetical protein [Luteimonas terrae]
MTRTFRNTTRAGVGALVLGLLAACATEPRLLLPTSPEGLACVAVCDAVLARCSFDETSQAQSIARSCDNSGEVQTCVDRAVDDRTVHACEAKQSMGACQGSVPNTAHCREDRLMCALQCGAKMLDP